VLSGLTDAVINDETENVPGIIKAAALYGHELLAQHLITAGVPQFLAHAIAEDLERFILTEDVSQLEAEETPLDNTIWRFCETKLGVSAPATTEPTPPVKATPAAPEKPTSPGAPGKAAVPYSKIPKRWQNIHDAYKLFFARNLRLPSYREICDVLRNDLNVDVHSTTVTRNIGAYRTTTKQPGILTTQGAHKVTFSEDSQTENDWQLLCDTQTPYKNPIDVESFASTLGINASQAKIRLDSINRTLALYGLDTVDLITGPDDEFTLVLESDTDVDQKLLDQYAEVIRAYIAVFIAKSRKLSALKQEARLPGSDEIRESSAYAEWLASYPDIDIERSVLPSQREIIAAVRTMSASRALRLLKELGPLVKRMPSQLHRVLYKKNEIETVGTGQYCHLTLLTDSEAHEVGYKIVPSINLALKLRVKGEVMQPTAVVQQASPDARRMASLATLADTLKGAVVELEVLPGLAVGIAMATDTTRVRLGIKNLFNYLKHNEKYIWRFGYLFLDKKYWQLYTATLAKAPDLSQEDIEAASEIYQTLSANLPLIELLKNLYFNEDIRPSEADDSSESKKGYVLFPQDVGLLLNNPGIINTLASMRYVAGKTTKGLLNDPYFDSDEFEDTAKQITEQADAATPVPGFIKAGSFDSMRKKIAHVTGPRVYYRIADRLSKQLARVALADTSLADDIESFLILILDKTNELCAAGKMLEKDPLRTAAINALQSLRGGKQPVPKEEIKQIDEASAQIAGEIDPDTDAARFITSLVASDIITVDMGKTLARLVSSDRLGLNTLIFLLSLGRAGIISFRKAFLLAVIASLDAAALDYNNKDAVVDAVSQTTGWDKDDVSVLVYGIDDDDLDKILSKHNIRRPTAILSAFYRYLFLLEHPDLVEIDQPNIQLGLNDEAVVLLLDIIADAKERGIIPEDALEGISRGELLAAGRSVSSISITAGLLSVIRSYGLDALKEAVRTAMKIKSSYLGINDILHRALTIIPDGYAKEAKRVVGASVLSQEPSSSIERLLLFLSIGREETSLHELYAIAMQYNIAPQSILATLSNIRQETEAEAEARQKQQQQLMQEEAYSFFVLEIESQAQQTWDKFLAEADSYLQEEIGEEALPAKTLFAELGINETVFLMSRAYFACKNRACYI
jgi:hypothetical protein